MSQQLQFGKYEFSPYNHQRNQLPKITTEEALEYLMSRLQESKRKGKARRRSVERSRQERRR
jgi:hypothetical protein